jgi:1-aminocyclopropane-1-carboxylate deaminase/D-cysteine desulfhydrase-like pyridoxal-dependent ACC family enzyme
MYIKRDDYSGLEISGNKARKLEFLLADALAQGADCVVTCGGIQSNHCRATAVAARMLGLDSYLLLRTNDVDEEPGLAGNLLIDRYGRDRHYSRIIMRSIDVKISRDIIIARTT